MGNTYHVYAPLPIPVRLGEVGLDVPSTYIPRFWDHVSLKIDKTMQVAHPPVTLWYFPFTAPFLPRPGLSHRQTGCSWIINSTIRPSNFARVVDKHSLVFAHPPAPVSKARTSPIRDPGRVL